MLLTLPLAADEPLRAVHEDAEALERAAADALLAFARDDGPRVVRALDIVAEQVRVLKIEERPIYGNVVSYSRSFEVSNNLSREYADGEMLDESYDQFVWVMKGCRTCHAIAKEQGIPFADD